MRLKRHPGNTLNAISSNATGAPSTMATPSPVEWLGTLAAGTTPFDSGRVESEFSAALATAEAGAYVRSLGEELMGPFADMVAAYCRGELQHSVPDRAPREALGEDIPARYVSTWRGLASEFGHTFGWGPDWEKIACTVTTAMRRKAEALVLLAEFGPDRLVYRLPLPTACPQCKALYLEADQKTPRIFSLGQMLAWGSNRGRKRLPMRDGVAWLDVPRSDGAETYKPGVGPVHSWCQCSAVALFFPVADSTQESAVSCGTSRDPATRVHCRSVDVFERGWGASLTSKARAYCGKCGAVLDERDRCPDCRRG
ncbi:MAG: hypothetical protein HY900_22040 [Deltaproteobacteria bacterium]|nr:hypothetical protein [Deltaproteobacteria bacterium]